MDPSRNRIRVVLVLCLLLASALFVGLRISYWSIVSEEPFSDMADYLSIAKRVLHQGSFNHDSFWQSYKPPTLPVLGAGVFWLAGSEDLLNWRVALGALTLLGVLWAAYEIAKVTNRHWVGLLLLVVVALSKSSIFWSLKFASEGAAEMLSYWSISLFLFSLRTKRAGAFFILGLVVMAAVLNRPQSLPILPLYFLLAIFLLAKRGRDLATRRSKNVYVLSSAFILGVSVCWAPWLARSWKLYGHVLAFSSQGPYSFLWELGSVSNRAGIVTDVTQLQKEAPKKFANDYEAEEYAQEFVSAWLSAHYFDYPELIFSRIGRSFNEQGIDLSKVSRSALFSSDIDGVLLDKDHAIALSGIAGLIVLIFYHLELGVLLISSLAPWLFGALFISSPRLLEPYIPIILFGNCAWLLLISSIRRRL